MTKIEELRAKLKLNNGCGCCSEWRDTDEMLSCVDELIQAVRDEEFEKHTEAECSIRKNNQHVGIHHFCATCKAKGTRYCP